MVETLAIAAVLTFSVGLGVALAPAVALNRSARSDRAKTSRRKTDRNERPRAPARKAPAHEFPGLSHDEIQACTLRRRLVKQEL